MRKTLVLAALLLFLSQLACAQVCNGSLGDPLININFDNGASGPLPYMPPLSGYTYQAGGCPDDGYYTIPPFIYSCFNNSWHDLKTDRSGKGSFLLINGSLQPAEFFADTVKGLCPNTTYEFSAWIVNMVIPFNEINPDIRFSVRRKDGTVIAEYNTGAISVTSSPQWRKYGVLFSTGSNDESIVLVMKCNAPGGNGNDFAMDDIGLRPCGPPISVSIVGSSTPDNIQACGNDTTHYLFTGGIGAGFQSPLFQWQQSVDSGQNWVDIPGATALSYVRPPTSRAGNYYYRLTVVDAAAAGISSCKISSSILSADIYPLPLADAGPDRVYIKGYPITLHGRAEGDQISYAWSPSLYMTDTSSLEPIVSPPAPIAYTLTVRSIANCFGKDTMQVKVVNKLAIPNAFTPNGDGNNDRWHIPYIEGLDADLTIYNRWGAAIFHGSGTQLSWDGRINDNPQPAGTYIYLLRFRNSNMPALKGVFLLLR